jgi:hypothetical protein
MCEADEIACTSRTCTGYLICKMVGIQIVQTTLVVVRTADTLPGCDLPITPGN